MEAPSSTAEPWRAAVAAGAWLSSFWQVWLGRMAGRDAVARASSRRLEALVRHARAHSPYCAELYESLPERIADIRELPVTTRHALMARFDDWVADRALSRAAVERFLADRSRIGERYLDAYVVWKSSGTSGEEGIFVQDPQALSIYDALLAVQLASPELVARCAAAAAQGGGRAALIAATGDHFASIASWQRVCRSSPFLAARGFSVMEPLDSLVRELNAFQPAYLASYPTMLAMLAEEQREGRLSIRPSLVWSGGEYAAPAALDALEAAFGARVMNEYGASECLSIAFGCPERWLHVNADWVIVEAVDADYQPVPPGATSHTALVTNLANRVQPVIRYDLGDSIVVHPGPCACGNPMPAIRVEGRRDDIATLRDGGHAVRVPPMALTTVLEEATGVHRFQLVNRGDDTLLVRLDLPRGRCEKAFAAGAAALRAYLARQGIANVRIALDDSPPRTDPRSGKLRQVVVEAKRDDDRAVARHQS